MGKQKKRKKYLSNSGTDCESSVNGISPNYSADVSFIGDGDGDDPGDNDNNFDIESYVKKSLKAIQTSTSKQQSSIAHVIKSQEIVRSDIKTINKSINNIKSRLETLEETTETLTCDVKLNTDCTDAMKIVGHICGVTRS